MVGICQDRPAERCPSLASNAAAPLLCCSRIVIDMQRKKKEIVKKQTLGIIEKHRFQFRKRRVKFQP
jgi:hypothetical protein